MNILIDKDNSNQEHTVGNNPKYGNLQKQFSESYLSYYDPFYDFEQDLYVHVLAQKAPDWN